MTHHSDLNGYFNKLPKMNYKSYCAVTEFASQWFRWRNIASTLYICLAYFVCRSFSHREDSLETKWNFIAGSVYIHVNRWKIALSFVCFGCDIFDFDAIRYFVHNQNARRNEMRRFICGFWDRSFGFKVSTNFDFCETCWSHDRSNSSWWSTVKTWWLLNLFADSEEFERWKQMAFPPFLPLSLPAINKINPLPFRWPTMRIIQAQCILPSK